MIAIIDSGSTKADWLFSDGKNITRLNTPGMNPFFVNEAEIIRIINDGIAKIISVNVVSKIYFYGAGCSSVGMIKIVSDAFGKVFKNAEIIVDHDIMGAVIATCGNKAGIACIIGTGSNSVYFDGKNIQPNNYGLGFILADEGAGSRLGMKLITHYIYSILPKELSDDFRKRYNLTRDDIIKNVYNNSTANTWLGSFAEFYGWHKDHPWVRKAIKKGFEKFIKLYVINYPDYQDVPVHFVGSIAFNYQDILKDIAKEREITLGKIIQKPIDELAEYFLKNGH